MREANINLNFIFNIILKNIVWILLASVLGGTAMYAYSKYTAVTVYGSSVKFLVRNISVNDIGDLKDEYSYVGLSPASIEASKSLINTYIEVIKTQDALEMFLEDIQENEGYTELLKEKWGASAEQKLAGVDPEWYKDLRTWQIGSCLSMRALGETEILQISVVASDEVMAGAISIAVENVVPSVINELYDIGSVRVIESALTTWPINSSGTVKVGLGVALGFILSAAIFFMVAYLDNTIKCEDDIKEALGVLALGEVPDLVEIQKHKSKYGKYDYDKYGYGYYGYGGYGTPKKNKEKQDKGDA